MRKLLSFLTLCTTLMFSSCSTDNNYDDGGYTEVKDGIVLIQSSYINNTCAMDAVSVATRLAILLREMELVGLEFTPGGGLEKNGVAQDGYSAVGNYTLNEVTHNKKELLFGDNDASTITLNLDGTYSVRYGYINVSTNYTSGKLDNIDRYGTYIIDTKGNSYWESSEATPWVVTYSESEMKYKLNYDDTNVYIFVNDQNNAADNRFSAEIYKDIVSVEKEDEFGVVTTTQITAFKFKVSNFYGKKNGQTYIEDPYWSGEGYFKFGNVNSNDGLTVENTMAYSTLFNLTASGLSAYNYDSEYTTPESIMYRPTTMYLTPASGQEKITNEYTGMFTTRTYTTQGYVVEYDGNTYTLTYNL